MDNEAQAKNLDWEHGDDAGTPPPHPPKQSLLPKQELGDATDRRRELSVLGQSLVFKGELEAEEDLMVDGRVEGTITHRANQLTIGSHGDVRADIMANRVLVQGRVVGNIHASEAIVIEPSARVAGNLFAPRIGLKEGAEFDGQIQMTRKSADAGKTLPDETRVSASAAGKTQPGDMRASASAGKAQPGERADARAAAAKRASSPKKTAPAAGTGMSDAIVDELLE